VPFIARWPGRIKPGSESAQVIGLVDMLATFASITGQELPPAAGPDSINMLPALLGETVDQPVRGPLVLQGPNPGRLGLRQGNWMYISPPGGEGSARPSCTTFPSILGRPTTSRLCTRDGHGVTRVARARSQFQANFPLKHRRWSEADLVRRRKCYPRKVALAARLRQETTLTVKAIATRLSLGTPRNASARLQEWPGNKSETIGKRSRCVGPATYMDHQCRSVTNVGKRLGPSVAVRDHRSSTFNPLGIE